MNKNLLPLLVGIIVIGAAGAFLLRRPAGTPEQTVGGSSPRTFAELMALGEDYTCTFEETDDTGNASSGTVYVADSGEKLNGHFFMTQPDGNEMESYVIRDGQYSYIWMSNQPDGYKMAINPEDDQLFPETKDGQEQTGLDENEPVDFDCQPWRPDNAMFTPPSDINFIDISAQMQMMEEQIDQVEQQTGANCSLCDQVPAGDARTQCLASLGC